MDYRKTFVVKPGSKVHLAKIDPSYAGKHESQEKALLEIQKHVERMNKLQYLLYADGNQSLLVVLQALDAAGKDGVIRHVFSCMNPQGTFVFGSLVALSPDSRACRHRKDQSSLSEPYPRARQQTFSDSPSWTSIMSSQCAAMGHAIVYSRKFTGPIEPWSLHSRRHERLVARKRRTDSQLA